MSYAEDDYLLLSGIQHFIFCRRQWALIYIEQQWAENYRTTDGKIMHENAHDSNFHETRKNVVIARSMAISSSRLGISGECDIVEFHRCADGVPVFGKEGTYSVVPIEYKRGKPKQDDCDVMQLVTQAMCLEDMLVCQIPFGYLYYGETRRRLKVEFDEELRRRTEQMIAEMHTLYQHQYTPKVKRRKACNACSLKDICLPVLCGGQTASAYMKRIVEGGEQA